MFKCKDCNELYETKPDYCNCGNNTFAQDAATPSPQKETVVKKTFFEQYPQIKNFINSIDILSGIVFVVCIILSIFSWNVIGSWKPSPTTPQKPQKQEVKAAQNASVPDINNLWNSTPPKPVLLKPEPAPEVLPQPQQEPLPIEAPQPEAAKPTPKLPVLPKAAKPTPKPPVQVAKPKAAPKSSAMSSEMKNYNEGLKEALFSQWAVGSISGEGLCEVEFSVSPSGKLLGRRFSKQSNNEVLNSSVYDMLMNTPQYSPPPSDYRGEKIRVSFYFNHGYYEVKTPKY